MRSAVRWRPRRSPNRHPRHPRSPSPRLSLAQRLPNARSKSQSGTLALVGKYIYTEKENREQTTEADNPARTPLDAASQARLAPKPASVAKLPFLIHFHWPERRCSLRRRAKARTPFRGKKARRVEAMPPPSSTPPHPADPDPLLQAQLKSSPEANTGFHSLSHPFPVPFQGT